MSDRISFFLKRLEESEGNLLNRFSLAQAYFESGDYDHSIKHLSICVTERKDWMFAFLLMAKAFLALEKFEDARNALEKTIFLAKIRGMKIPRKKRKNFCKNVPRTELNSLFDSLF